MIKTFCDSCGEETDTRTIGIPSHLYSFAGKCGYIDKDLNPVTPRVQVLFYLSSALKELMKLQKYYEQPLMPMLTQKEDKASEFRTESGEWRSFSIPANPECLVSGFRKLP